MDNALTIDVSGLCKSFHHKPAVIDLALQVKRGEIFGFLGPNGSGKTTTLRMLCGLLKPDAGKGFCLGYDILTESIKIKRQLGYMTQQFSLYKDLTVIENLRFMTSIYQMPNPAKHVEKNLKELGLWERRNQLVKELSGGWKQRLALAAALSHEPKLLLLDEPAAGVDPKARREFWDYLHVLASQGITSLVSTHYMDEAERCHRLAYITLGRLRIHGTTNEIVKSVGLTTWSATGQNLSELAERLRNLAGVDQVIVYGINLHVCGKNAELLSQSIKPFQTKETQWTLIDTTIEDVFIYLTSETAGPLVHGG